MTYMLLIYQPADYQPSESAGAEMFQAYMAYSEQLRKAGAYVDGAALVPPTSATTVRLREGKKLITDGPFAETKEWLGGFYVLECDSLDRALELAADCPGAKNGSVEIRPFMELPD